MKKLVCLLLVAVSLFAAVGLAGCGEKDEFVEVYSVSYSSGGTNTTVYSTFTIKIDERQKITAEEYNNFNGHKRPHDTISGIKIDKERTNIPTGIKAGDYFVYSYYDYEFYKAKVTSIEINFVNIKAISDREYLLKNNSGTIKVISDYFIIEYFD